MSERENSSHRLFIESGRLNKVAGVNAALNIK